MRIKETIVNGLRNAIVRGDYKPGEHLKELSLCAQFQISRTPIREALKELEKEGLIETRPNMGARVIKLSKNDVSNIYDVLITIEGAACRLACLKITSEQMNRLEEYHFLMEKAVVGKNYELLFELNREFHKLIVDVSKNPYLMQIWSNLRHLVDRFGRIVLTPMFPGQLNATLEEHPQIISALKKENSAMAEFVARKHIETGRKYMFEYLEKFDH